MGRWGDGSPYLQPCGDPRQRHLPAGRQVVVSCRGRRAMRTLPGSPLRRPQGRKAVLAFRHCHAVPPRGSYRVPETVRTSAFKYVFARG